MSFILGFLGVIIGICVVVFLIAIYIITNVNKMVGVNNIKTIFNAAKNAKQIAEEDYSRQKNVGGITKLLEPEILRDFPDFNKNLLYSMIESNLRKIFTAIENKSIAEIKNDEDLILICSSIEEQIKDLESTGTRIKYDDVVFHEHAIKNYEKTRGMATITTSTTLEYYYKNSDKMEEMCNNIKRQTRYTCKFVYIYDETKLGKKNDVFTIHCPNCGAPIRKFSLGNCEYCMSHIEPINLKLWKMSSYKEDYK